MNSLKGLSYWEIAQHPVIWLIFGTIVALVVIQCLFFFKKASNRALDLGYTNDDIKKIIKSSISVAVLPTISIAAVLLALIPTLGGVLPWYRISVIGSAPFESMMASLAAEAAGATLTATGMTPKAFGAACLIMSFGGTCYAIFAVGALKPISLVYDKLRSGTAALIAVISSCCLGGVVSAIASNYYDASDVSLAVFAVAALATALLMYIGKKDVKYKKLDQNASGIATVLGMVAAVLLSL